MKKVLLDTNLFIDWMNTRSRDDLIVGPGYARYLSGIVLMELRAGARTRPASRALDSLFRAYRDAGRLVLPGAAIFDGAGRALQKLRRLGAVDVRGAAIVHDVLIALSARSIGATVLTRDADLAIIRRAVPFDWARVT